MSISNLSDEELLGLYKQPNDISSISDEELMKMYKPQPTKQPVQQRQEEVIEQPTPMLTGGVEQKVIQNWDSKGRVYYTDEQGNRIKSNVPLSRKIGNQLRATATNLSSFLNDTYGQNYKDRQKAVAMGVLTAADLALNQGRGLLSHAVGGGVGSGLYSLADQAIEGEFNPKQLAIDTGLGVSLGVGGKAIQPIAKNIARRRNIAKRRATPLAERMTDEQLERLTDPKVEQNKNAILDYETMPNSELDYRTMTDDELELLTRPNEPIQIETIQSEKSEINQQLADNINNKINNTLEKIKNHENTVLEINQKYGGIDNLRKELARQTDEYGRVADVDRQQTFDRYLAEQRELANDPYFDFASNIDRRTKKMSATWETPPKKYTQQGQEQIEEILPTTQEKNVKPTRSVQQFNDVVESVPQQLDDVIPEQVSGDIKKRSLQQSVLEAKGTPKEVKEIIKENPATYEVLKNKDLVAQASKELEGNFDNELVRLASAKDFDALDYEKSHQIARQLFGMGDYRRAVDLIDNVSENATKKGQAIQALSLWSNMTPEGAVYKAQKLLKEYNKKHPKKQIQLTDENIETIANLQKEALNTTDELAKNQASAKTMKYVSDLIPKEALQKLKAYRNISLLLNPKTLGRNVVGNLLFNTIDTGAKGVANWIDTGISKFTGQKTRVAPQLGNYFKGGLQGLARGSSEALQGIDTRGLGQRFDLGSGRTFVGGNTERTTIADIINAQQGNKLDTTKQYFQELLPKSRIGQAITQRSSQPLKQIPSDFMNSLETALDVGLRTPDRAFYEATFAESVENMMKAQGLTKPTQEILEQAEREALESVFQNQSKVSDLALGLRSGLNRIGTKEFGLGDVLIPYAQTPANLAQQGINYSPLKPIGLTSGALAKGIGSGLRSAWDDRVLGVIPNIKSGAKNTIESLQDSATQYFKDNQRQASLDLARSLIGTGLIGGGYGLSKAGLMTPSQFDDNYQTNKKIRENLQPLGIRPDQLGDMWYAPFQPMSIPLAVGNAVAYGKDPLQAGINTVVDLPFLQGISRGLRDLQEGNSAQAGVNVASSIPSQFVPTLGSQFAQTIDPYQRETYDPNKLQYGLNSAIAKVPFASKTLPEKIDVTGQPIERYSTKGGQKLFDIFLNPTFINEKTTDPVLSELKYIYDQTKETSHFMPSVKKKLEFTDVDGNPQKLVLTGREFSEYQRRLGQRMYNEFDYIMDLPEYANADEYGKIKILEKAKELVQAEVDNEMWNKRNRNKKRSYTKGN